LRTSYTHTHIDLPDGVRATKCQQDLSIISQFTTYNDSRADSRERLSDGVRATKCKHDLAIPNSPLDVQQCLTMYYVK